MSNFGNSNVYGRRKYAEFCEVSLKIHKIKIQPMNWLKTQIQFETFAKKWKKNELGTAYQDVLLYYAPNLRKCLNKAKQTTFTTFQNSEGNLVMHFHKTCL